MCKSVDVLDYKMIEDEKNKLKKNRGRQVSWVAKEGGVNG